MKTKGFTLVELLVVIAILAILATVSVVGYTSYIQNANDSVAVQELSQLRDSALAVDLTKSEGGNMDGKVSVGEFKEALTNAGITFNENVFVITHENKEGVDAAKQIVTKVVYKHSNGGVATWTVSGDKVEAGEK
ncbi:MAG: prepilin-type N-terminal cleavage/methylation domain-containing protein [Clostridia bacterium]|nr:prepilin-type N-terminal cleavage/methylation domain-containing protein [Clostridia bacterium]